MSTDLVLHTLTVEGATSEPTGLIFVDGSGEVAPLDDPAAVARWLRTTVDLEQEALRPAKAVAAAALYAAMDAQGVYTLHTDDGLTVVGESRATWEDAVTVDADALYDDLVVLAERAGLDDAHGFAAGFFRVERTLTAAGRTRLEKMSGAYREALREHSKPAERSRKTPSVRRSK